MDGNYDHIPTYKEAVRQHDAQVRAQVGRIWWGYHDALIDQIKNLGFDFRCNVFFAGARHRFSYFEVIT